MCFRLFFFIPCFLSLAFSHFLCGNLRRISKYLEKQKRNRKKILCCFFGEQIFGDGEKTWGNPWQKLEKWQIETLTSAMVLTLRETWAEISEISRRFSSEVRWIRKWNWISIFVRHFKTENLQSWKFLVKFLNLFSQL